MLVDDGHLDKPWMGKRNKHDKLAYFLTYTVAFIGVVGGALNCYFDYPSVPFITSNLCPVLDVNFDTDQDIFGDNGVFFREVDMSGFGNGEFEMTTNSPNNSFVHDGKLYLLPTLTEDSIGQGALLDGHIYNITDCTFNITSGLSYTQSSTHEHLTAMGSDSDFDVDGYYRACSAISNSTVGNIITPVQSAS